jgi:large subunit ribosomal protein L29
MATAEELREFDDVELGVRLSEEKQALFNLRFRHATGQQDNTTEIGKSRRNIARILTILREREIAAAETAGTTGPAPAPASAASALGGEG